MSNKQIFNCKTCKAEILEHQIHKPEECIAVLQAKLTASNKEVEKWRGAWYDQRDATGRASWQFIEYPYRIIACYKESFAAAKKS